MGTADSAGAELDILTGAGMPHATNTQYDSLDHQIDFATSHVLVNRYIRP
jgi:hypothetical protein